MTRNHIGGHLSLQALAALATLHKPNDQAALAGECARLVGDGLSIPDVAMALHLTPRAVADLLTINLEE